MGVWTSLNSTYWITLVCLEKCSIKYQNGESICSNLYEPAHIAVSYYNLALRHSVFWVLCASPLSQPVITRPLCLAGGEDISSADSRRAGKRAEPVPGPVLHLPPQPQWDHPQWVDGPSQTGMTWQLLYYEHFHAIAWWHCPRTSEGFNTFFCTVCSEKPSCHPLGGGAAGPGAADDERGRQSESGLAAQLPHPQHVQRGPRGHLHQGGRCQTLAGQRSVVTALLFIIETGKRSVGGESQMFVFWFICLPPLLSVPSVTTLFIGHALSPQHCPSSLCLPPQCLYPRVSDMMSGIISVFLWYGYITSHSIYVCLCFSTLTLKRIWVGIFSLYL